jgi:thymidylate synthase (FAD)
MAHAEKVYLKLIREGASPQEARSVLPNSLKTEVVMTANLREWKHVFQLRCSRAAHPQIREIMLPLLADLHKRVPVVFEPEYEKYVKEDLPAV